MKQRIKYGINEKNLEWQFKDYYFKLPETIEQILEIDNNLQFSVIQARIDLILSSRLFLYMLKKEDVYKIMILLKNNYDLYL